jgi:hypothetical protein
MHDICETGDVTCNSGRSVVEPSSGCQARSRRLSPIRLTFFLGVTVVVVYAAYGRVGTTANADSVEHTQNLAGGFLTVGMTKDQPGFMVLSELDQKKVDVKATQVVNQVAGTHTVVEVETPRDTARIRLRGPQVILISEEGALERHEVDWTVAEFNALREAADCSHEAAIKKHRCGAPFTDLQEALAKWPAGRVPERLRSFLEPFTDKRTREHKHD